MVSVTLRGIREDIYRAFKAKAALLGISLKKALEEAMKLWINSTETEWRVTIDADEIVARLRADPAEPFVFQPKSNIGATADVEWARKKLGMMQS